MEKEYVLFSLAMLALGFKAGEIRDGDIFNSLDYTKEYKEQVFDIEVPQIYVKAGKNVLSSFIRSISSRIFKQDIFKNIELNFIYYDTTTKIYNQNDFWLYIIIMRQDDSLCYRYLGYKAQVSMSQLNLKSHFSSVNTNNLFIRF